MATPPASAPDGFRAWFGAELLAELKLSAIFLSLGLVFVIAAQFVSPSFSTAWARLNVGLTQAALEQHPTALLERFAGRLAEHEYGWHPLAWSSPFNVTHARETLRADFPEFVGVAADGRPIPVRVAAKRRADSAVSAARAAAYLARHHQIESGRFTRLYRDDSGFNAPDASTRLARVVTKALGVPDALLHLVHNIIAGGIASILLASGTIAIAAVALWSSARPARRWLKVLLVPFLAAALGWITVLSLSLAAALFGGFTANTAGLALFATAPLIYLAAKAPLRLFEELQLKPKPWDGVERRRGPRPPTASA